MEIRKIAAPEKSPVDRVYIAVATLKNFKGRKQVEVHLFRNEYDDSELEKMRGTGLVGAPDPLMPPELISGASEDAALRCILEAFTAEECEKLASYLQSRYADQIASLVLCPMSLPVPLGVGSLAAIPEGPESGFIRFDKAENYNLPFAMRGYYDLGAAQRE